MVECAYSYGDPPFASLSIWLHRIIYRIGVKMALDEDDGDDDDDDDDDEDPSSLVEMSQVDFEEFTRWLKGGATGGDTSSVASEPAPETPGASVGASEMEATTAPPTPAQEKVQKFDEQAESSVPPGT